MNTLALKQALADYNTAKEKLAANQTQRTRDDVQAFGLALAQTIRLNLDGLIEHIEKLDVPMPTA